MYGNFSFSLRVLFIFCVKNFIKNGLFVKLKGSYFLERGLLLKFERTRMFDVGISGSGIQLKIAYRYLSICLNRTAANGNPVHRPFGSFEPRPTSPTSLLPRK